MHLFHWERTKHEDWHYDKSQHSTCNYSLRNLLKKMEVSNCCTELFYMETHTCTLHICKCQLWIVRMGWVPRTGLGNGALERWGIHERHGDSSMMCSLILPYHVGDGCARLCPILLLSNVGGAFIWTFSVQIKCYFKLYTYYGTKHFCLLVCNLL